MMAISKNSFRVFSIVFALLFVLNNVYGTFNKQRSYSTSIDSMLILIETEQQLLGYLENYANALENKLKIIKSAIKYIRTQNTKANENPEQYLSNPLNCYSMIRRLHADWDHWAIFIEKKVGAGEIELIRKHRTTLPNNIDLEEASFAIDRLQTTYDLNVFEMSKGFLNGKQYNTSLSSLDCYLMGYHLLNVNNYKAGLWLSAALEQYEKNDVYASMEYDQSRIHYLHADVKIKQFKYADAINHLNIAEKYDPYNSNIQRKKTEAIYQMKTSSNRPTEKPTTYPDLFSRSCRGELTPHLSKLHCRYNTTTSAFLKLAPLKMEELNLDPYMVLYHDVISDSEIAELKHRALPVLKRSTIFEKETQTDIISNERTSKYTWFLDNENTALKQITARIADMTGFDMAGAEPLSVMNYGLGGHYGAHYDFFNTSKSDVNNSDRISTVLIYLTDVEQGGATVFPYLHIAVLPRKGTALVWYNLNDRGEGDWKTLHGACPVIVGSKWVGNKWIRERNQLFRRPCNT